MEIEPQDEIQIRFQHRVFGTRSSSLEICFLSSAVRSIYLTRNCCNQCGAAFNCLPGEREEYCLEGERGYQLEDSDKAMSKCQRFQPKTFHRRQEDDFGLMRKSPTSPLFPRRLRGNALNQLVEH